MRVQDTAKAIQHIMKEYANKDIEIVSRNYKLDATIEKYFSLLQQYTGQKILITGNQGAFNRIRTDLYTGNEMQGRNMQNLEVVELPTYTITNDLDKRILSELHAMMLNTDTLLKNYALDEAVKSVMEFMDKLTNRYLRRSRRRFRANGMDNDKSTAYTTLYKVMRKYLQIIAPFAPFVAEYLWLQLDNFKKEGEKSESIHLSYRPMMNEKYINAELMEEIATVRKIIKSALFIRAKNKIAVKQPLSKLEIKID